jgi:YcxB-like protein
MKISYVNTPNDIFWFNIYNQSRNRTSQLTFFLTIVLTGFLFSSQVPMPQEGALSYLVEFIVFELFMVLLYMTITIVYFLFSTSPLKNIAVLTNHEITLSEENIIEETPFNRGENSWSGINKVVQNRSYIFIYVSQHGSHVIPKRAFRSVSQTTEFFNYAYECWQKHKIINI